MITRVTTAPDAPPLTPRFTPHSQEHFSEPGLTVQARLDLFPSEVTFTTTSEAGASALQLPKCRTIVTPTEVFVFTDGPRGPVLAFYDGLAPGTQPEPTPTKGYLLTPDNPGTHQVTQISVEPTNRCGCGSRLRGYRPFGRISYVPST